MANLINDNSKQNYFNFNGSNYIYEKGLPLGCLFPGQYSRTFYRIWNVNLQKAVTKVQH